MEDPLHAPAVNAKKAGGQNYPTFVIDTAGAPASPSRRLPTTPTHPPEWIELPPAGVFYGRDRSRSIRLDDPDAVIESTDDRCNECGPADRLRSCDDFGAARGPPGSGRGNGFATRRPCRPLWGRVEWKRARAADSRRARVSYVSPVFQFVPQQQRDPAPARRPHQQSTCIDPRIAAAETVAAAERQGRKDGLPPQNLPNKDLEHCARCSGLTRTRRAPTSSQRFASCGRLPKPPASAIGAHANDPGHYGAIAEFERALTSSTLSGRALAASARASVEDAIRAGKIVPRTSATGRLLTAPPTRAASRASPVSSRRSSAPIRTRGESPVDRRREILNQAELVHLRGQLGLKHSEF